MEKVIMIERAKILDKLCVEAKRNQSISDIAREFNINYRTAALLKSKAGQKEKLEKITITRALKELRFKRQVQKELFEYLITGLNYFKTFETVTKVINISRHHYNVVKQYIAEELENT